MFLEKVAENKFSLGFAVHGNFAIEVHIDRSVKELDDLFGIACLNGILHGRKDILRRSTNANAR
jgi:hypothetical protein